MKSVFKNMLLATATALGLIACGGGGGGGGGGGNGGSTPTITASKSSVQFEAYTNEYWYPDGINVSLSGGSGGVYVGVSSSDPSVVTVAFTVTGATTGSISVAPVQNKAVGSYSADVVFSLYADPGGSQRIAQYTYPVTLTVHAGLTVNPTALALSAAQGAVAQTTIAVTPPAGVTGTLSASAISFTPWLTLTPVGNTAVEVSASTLLVSLPGTTTAEIAIRFTRTGAMEGGSVIVPITFTIDPGLITPTAHAVELRRDTDMTSLTWPRNVAVQRGDGGASAWSASSDASWVTLPTSSGTTPGTLTFSVDPLLMAALPEFADSTATVTIASPGLPSVYFPVILQKRLPYVATAQPSSIPVNSTSMVVVDGKGFTQLYDPAALLQTSGLAVSNVHVLSDAQLAFEATPTATGSHVIGIRNVAGISTSTATLTVSNPPASGGAIRPLAGHTLFYMRGTVR